MIKILDNFLNEKDFDELKSNIIDTSNFPWYLSKGINADYDGGRQFYHYFYDNNSVTSNFFNILNPILKKLKINSLVRIKANLTPKTSSIVEYKYHTDIKFYNDIVCNTSIFYLNSNNGYTLFKNLPNVESIENRFLCFNSNIEHGGTTCTDKDFRIVLNFNYF